MSVSTGNVGIRTDPTASEALRVAGDIRATGRLQDGRVRSEVARFNSVQISAIANATAWNNVPDMSAVIVAPPGGAWFEVRFSMNGVQAEGLTQTQAEFRLLVDGTQQDYTLNEYHNNGWELRGITLQRMLFLTAGAHSLIVQWSIKSPGARPAIPPFLPEVRVRLTGCFYGDGRCLSAVEL
jgi:hypothetical protein